MTANPTPLQTRLTNLLADSPGLVWISSSEADPQPVEAVRLTPKELVGYTIDGLWFVELNNQGSRSGWANVWARLYNALDSPATLLLKKATGNPSEYETLILTPDGNGWVGLRAITIET